MNRTGTLPISTTDATGFSGGVIVARDPSTKKHSLIDSVYVFGFDLTETLFAKGGIWNAVTGKPETPLNYTNARKDTVDSVPVVKLYRQVVPGNHPLTVGKPGEERRTDGSVWRNILSSSDENLSGICTFGAVNRNV